MCALYANFPEVYNKRWLGWMVEGVAAVATKLKNVKTRG